MTLTRGDIREKLYELFGEWLGLRGTASVSGLSVTAPALLGKTRYGNNAFAGRIIYLPEALSDADQEKLAGNISGTVLTAADSTNYANNYVNTLIEILARGVTPDMLNGCIRRAHRDVYFKGYNCVTLFEDGDCEAADIGSWAFTASASGSKSTSAEDNQTGVRSLVVVYSAADQYAQNNLALRLAPGSQVYLAAQLTITTPTGPAYFDIWDGITSLIERITVEGREPMHVGKTFTVPDSGLIYMRLGGTDGSTVAWDCFPSHRIRQTYWKTPSFLDAGYKLLSLDEARYFETANNQQYVHTLASKRYASAARDIDYNPENLEEDSNPNAIQILDTGKWARGLPANDLFYHVQRRESDRTAMTDEDATTNADEDMLMAACIVNVGKMLNNVEGGTAWSDVVAENELKLATQRVIRTPTIAPREKQHMWFGR